MIVKLHKTDTPYRITKSTLDGSENIKMGSANSKPQPKKLSVKKISEMFFCQYLISFGLLTEGGKVIFAKRPKGTGGTISFFEVDVLKEDKSEKVTYTLDGVSDSPLGIALRLIKLGANSFYFSMVLNDDLIEKNIPIENTLLSFFYMMLNSGNTPHKVSIDIKGADQIAYLTPESGKLLLQYRDGKNNLKKKVVAKTKKSMWNWIRENVSQFSIPASSVFKYSQLKYASKLALIAEKSSISIFKMAIWNKGIKNISKILDRQKNVSFSSNEKKTFIVTSASNQYFKSIIEKIKPNPQLVMVVFDQYRVGPGTLIIQPVNIVI
jgi:hypothetical protein